VSSESQTEIPGTDQIETLWQEFTGNHETLHERIRAQTQREIDERCKEELNAGNYDAAVSLADIFEWFREEHLSDESPFVTEVLESDAVFMETLDYSRERLGTQVFKRLVEELNDRDELIYVSDRQRVRSHVAELARYFALVRQRIRVDGLTDYGFAPNLVKMVKLDIIDRDQPITDSDRTPGFGRTLRQVNKRINRGDAEPAAEFRETLGDRWPEMVGETVDAMGKFFETGLPDDFETLAQYQTDAFVDLYVDAVTDSTDKPERSQVITASTGGGKTEAFLFPTLAYCHTAWRAGISGNKAVLTYPRQDLCNNQFERLVDYVFTINEQVDEAHASFQGAPISVGIQHGSRGSVEIECPFCDDDERKMEPDDDESHFVCTRRGDHQLEWATTDRSASADIIITTQDSLHVRLMDRYGNDALWQSSYPTKFLVLDEVHVYTEQSGMHVSNVVRRFKQGLRHKDSRQTPMLVASSATIHNAKDFTRRIFDTDEAEHIHPAKEDTETLGSEYMLFVKATEPRDVAIPIGDSVFKPRDRWDNLERTTASNLSCMIQIAFAFYHTMRKEAAGSRPDLDVDKDRILGFVDSIDSVGRLGNNVEDAERERELFTLRRPDAFLDGEGTNPDCPSAKFREGADPVLGDLESAVCEQVTPNPHLNSCSVYEDGECWWTMRESIDLRPMNMAIHKSGKRQRPTDPRDPGDDWDQLIATSALEVGFDHPSIIGTFQYRAPMSVPSFLQRKGRGGRDAEDKPVTVVVLGSTSTDSFYFHHSENLSDPRDEHLEVPLDEKNQFVRAEHMTAAIFDYFSVHDTVNSTRIYRGWDSNYEGPDFDHLEQQLNQRRDDLREWLVSAFDAGESDVERVLNELKEYVELLDEPLAPGEDDTVFWKAFSRAVSEAEATGSSARIDELASELRGDPDE
jgi:hypothetical protein